MSNKSSTATSGGIGFCGLLTIVFITLKLPHFIDWSRWWVCAPILIGPGILIAILLVLGLFAGVLFIAEHVIKGMRS